MSARWYSAVIVLSARVAAESVADEQLLDHQVCLIQASSADEAYMRALAHGAQKEHSYLNESNQEVAWEFVGLADLDELLADELEDGVEVFSWRSRGLAADAVREREHLAVFQALGDRDRTAHEVLDEHESAG